MSMTTELIDRLKPMAAQEGAFDDKIKGRNAKTLLEAIDTIQLLSEKLHTSQMERSSQHYNGGWIPCKDRLPEKNVEVLATTEWGAVTIAEMYSANDWLIHEGTTNAEIDEIVSWMPLPQPYQPKEVSEWMI